MPTLTISLPEEVKTTAEADACRAGQTLEQYVASLIIAHADQHVSSGLEAELLKGLNSPGRDLSIPDWEQRKRRLQEQKVQGQ